MTSSLVGSEMCIRDSSYTSIASAATSPATKDKGNCDKFNMDEGCSLPVSYTHLTLPTICSV
eukprot:6988035-Prorocentrum_lima.AAC.1